jgi:hypothetical protein
MPTISILTSPKPINKHFNIVDGNIKKTISPHSLSRFTVEQRSFATLDDLLNIRQSLKSNQVIVNALCDVDYIPTATADHFYRDDKTGVFFIDVDDSQGMSEVELIAFYRSLHPLIEKTDIALAYSNSDGLFIDGQSVASSGGYRLFFMIEKASETKHIADQIQRLEWAAGKGRVVASKDGSALKRQLSDQTIYNVNRLDFAGQPVLLNSRITRESKRGYVDKVAGSKTVKLFNVDPTLFDQLYTKELKKTAPQRKRIAKEYRETEAPKVAKANNITITQAKRLLSSYALSSSLPHWWPLIDEYGVTMTVVDAMQLKSGHRFYDPIEPDYGSRSTAMLFHNIDDSCVLFSYAHGGKSYVLKEKEIKKYEPILPGISETISRHEVNGIVTDAILKAESGKTTAIAINVGAGKTRGVEVACTMTDKKILILVPRHDLAEQIAEKIDGAMIWQGIGRACARAPIIDEYQRKTGDYSARTKFCGMYRNEHGYKTYECEHARNCAYIKQERKLQHARVVIATHEMLTLGIKFWPDICVIDESIWQKMVAHGSIKKEDIPMTDDGQFDRDKIRTLLEQPTISIDAYKSDDDLYNSIKAYEPRLTARQRRSYQAILSPTTTIEDDGVTIKWYRRKEIKIRREIKKTRRTHKLGDAAFVLFDAQAHDQILKPLFPDVTFKKYGVIDVDGIHITQCWQSWHKKRQWRPGAAGQIAALAQMLPNCGVITQQELADRLESMELPNVKHFNAVTGLDTFAMLLNGIIVGRTEPRVEDVLALAKCLWSDVDTSKKYIRSETDYGTVNDLEDERARLILGQLRDCELMQAVGRWRYIHPIEGRDKDRNLIIIGNTPIPDVIVDKHLTDEKQLLPDAMIGRYFEKTGQAQLIPESKTATTEVVGVKHVDFQHSIKMYMFDKNDAKEASVYAENWCGFLNNIYKRTTPKSHITTGFFSTENDKHVHFYILGNGDTAYAQSRINVGNQIQNQDYYSWRYKENKDDKEDGAVVDFCRAAIESANDMRFMTNEEQYKIKRLISVYRHHMARGMVERDALLTSYRDVFKQEAWAYG